MIELNLMPTEMRAAENKKKPFINLKSFNIAPAPAIVGVISVIILSQIAIGAASFIQKKQIMAVSKSISDIAKDQAIAAVLKKELDELSGKFTAIEGLAQGSLSWSEKLSDLSDAMIDGIWLNSLSLEIEKPLQAQFTEAGVMARNSNERQTLVLSGFAVSSTRAEETAAVGRFIDSLKKNEGFFKDFNDINLTSIYRESYGDIDVMRFIIVCYFKTDRSYFEKHQR